MNIFDALRRVVEDSLAAGMTHQEINASLNREPTYTIGNRRVLLPDARPWATDYAEVE